MTSEQELLKAVESYIKRENIAPSTFGAKVLGDPRFIHDLRNGRSPKMFTVKKVMDAIKPRKEKK